MHVPVEERRRQLIDAAIKVISREGVSKASTRRIAEEAKANLATVHYSFKNKEELFAAVLEHSVQLIDQILPEDRIEEGCGLRIAVQSLIETNMQFVESNPELQITIYELVFWSLRTSQSRELAPTEYKAVIRSVANRLRRAATAGEHNIDADHLACLTVGALDGLQMQLLALGTHAVTDFDYAAIADSLVTLARTFSSGKSVTTD